jgi:hypothetical protein
MAAEVVVDGCGGVERDEVVGREEGTDSERVA